MVKGSIWVAVVALAALAAPATGAKEPPPPPAPAGGWFLNTQRATYSGPPASVRSMLTKIIQNRVDFTPLCAASSCASMVTVRRPPRGAKVRFTLSSQNGPFVGSVKLASNLRCGGRPLRATLTMSVVTGRTVEGLRVTGMWEAKTVNPGGCAVFRGKSRAIRRVWFEGVSANG